MSRKKQSRAKVNKTRDAAADADRVVRLEWIAAVLLTVLVLFSHAELFRHVGGLWRDEVNTVNLATMPSLADVWKLNQFDSFPILWFLVVRGWTAVSSAASDTALRCLGLLVGVATVAVLWLNARKFLNYTFPLLALMLIGINPEYIRWGDSLRAYGFGTLAILFAFGLLWHAFQSPTPWRVALAVLSAVCAVQSLYYNSVLLFAVGVACLIVAFRRRQWRRGLLVAGIGVIAAVTMLPYFGTVHRLEQWNMLVQVPFDGHRLWSRLCVPLGAQGQFMIWIWAALTGLAMITAMVAQIRRLTPDLSDERRDLALFGGSALMIGLVGYIAFLKVLSYGTEPWYYLTLMAFTALAIEVVLSMIFTTWPMKLARIVLVAVVVILSIQPLRQSLQARQTNIDLIAANIGEKANQNDLIIINGWVMGVTFDRYFKGHTPWMTIPPIDDHKLHRYDLIKELMLTPQPLQPLLEAMRRTLQSGHRLWIVGALPVLPSGQAPQSLPPPPFPGSGWNEAPYDYAWALQVGYFIQSHVTDARVEKFGEPVEGYENPMVEIVEGWQSGPGK